PPGVVLAFGPQVAVAVDPAALKEKFVEPGALFGQAAGVLLVRGPVTDVLAGVHDVPVAADHVIAAAGQPLVEARRYPLHAAELVVLAHVAGRAGGEIQRHHAQVAETRLDVAALFVEGRPAQAGQHFVGRLPAVDADAAVTLLGGRVAEV